MMAVMTIESLQNPRLKAVVKLRQHRTRRQTGLFVVESVRDIDRALASGLVMSELYARGMDLPKWPLEAEPVTEAVLAKMTYRENPQGVVAVFEQRSWTWEQLWAKEQGLWLVAVGVQKPGNLGAMARTAEAAGAGGMIVVDGEVDPWNPNAIRASTGAVFGLPMVGCDAVTAMEQLRSRQIQIISTSDQVSRSWDAVDMTGPTAIVIGAEDQGLEACWLEESADLKPVGIPMASTLADSLNASVAAGILLYEAVRQRQSV